MESHKVSLFYIWYDISQIKSTYIKNKQIVL